MSDLPQQYESVEVALSYRSANLATLRVGDEALPIASLRVYSAPRSLELQVDVDLRYSLPEDLSTHVQLAIPGHGMFSLRPRCPEGVYGAWQTGATHLKALPASPEDQTMLVLLLQHVATNFATYLTLAAQPASG